MLVTVKRMCIVRASRYRNIHLCQCGLPILFYSNQSFGALTSQCKPCSAGSEDLGVTPVLRDWALSSAA